MPPPGGASQELASTNIGNGLGLRSGLAPTSTKWHRVVVVDDRTAIVMGSVMEEAVAIRTTDRGRTWQTLRTTAGKWQSWGVSVDGSVALASGSRKKMKAGAGKQATVEKAQIWFGPADGEMGEPAPLFGAEDSDKHKSISIADGVSRPAVLTSELAGLIADSGRSPTLIYGVPGGSQQPDPAPLPPGQWIRSPYGRPPNLISLSGASIEMRPWPKPGEKVDLGSKVPGVVITRSMAQQMNEGPDCESGRWSFARVASAPTNAYLIGIADTQAFGIKLPKGQEDRIGCSTEAVVVETVAENDAGPPEPQFVRCTFDGKCAEPKSRPFNIWPEEHKRNILAVPTKTGIVATLAAQSGNRFGTYLATSMDEGRTFELPRIIGESQTGRGFFDVGALIAFEDRVVMLFTADVTGTRGRRWYAMASDDGGENWSPP